MALAAVVLAGCSSKAAQPLAGGSATGDSAGAAAASKNGAVVVGSDGAQRKPAPALVSDKAARSLPPVHVDDVSEVAQARTSSVAVYRTETDSKPFTTLRSPLPSKAPLVMLVQERGSSRIRVLLPVRPNGSQGWVKASDVALSKHAYRITVSVSRHVLTLYRSGSVVMTERVGLGTSATPTPGGVFYTKELLRPPNPGGAYGPYAYGLSGYSEVLDEFLGGDGEIGIHGTNDPAGLGKNVSHGCIRMSNAAITKLAGMLPLGVPVQMLP